MGLQPPNGLQLLKLLVSGRSRSRVGNAGPVGDEGVITYVQDNRLILMRIVGRKVHKQNPVRVDGGIGDHDPEVSIRHADQLERVAPIHCAGIPKS